MSQSVLAELQNQYRLLQMEFEQEKEMFREQTEKAGIARRIQQGLCWYPLRLGRERYNALNQLVIEIERLSGTDVEHAFEYGKPVRFFHTRPDGRIEYLKFNASVSYVNENRMGIVLPSASAIIQLNLFREIGIQLYFDESSYREMFDALSAVSQAQGNRLAELREILLGKQPANRLNLLPMRFPWLNASQEAAVNQVLEAKDVAIVHGPPGTGKTTTLVEAIYETLHRESQVLVCAQSNTAVDWISEKLTDRGLHVLRIGNPNRVNDKMLSFTYERRFEAHPDYPELWSIRKAVREISSRLGKMKREDKESARNRLGKLRSRATALEIKINTELFDEAHVVACTLVGSAKQVLSHRKFNSLFIDEASQALEAACWIAIRKANRVILAGDHHQLPPTIKCYEAARAGLDHTLMQKIAERKPECVSLLTIQYRMNETIMGFSSHWFYQDMLQAAPEVKDRLISSLDTPLVWIDTSQLGFEESLREDSQSRVNPEEAALLVSTLQAYIEEVGPERILEDRIDFGLISPYKAQVYHLRSLLKKTTALKAFRPLFTVHTVDGFQGQERDVILISLVRANEQGRIGFLRDLRRMNVAMTRARMKLIIVGDAGTLSRHPFYARLLRYIQENGQVRSLLPPESKDTASALPDAKSSENQP